MDGTTLNAAICSPRKSRGHPAVLAVPILRAANAVMIIAKPKKNKLIPT